MYRKGWGTKVDYYKSFVHYKLAIDLGVENAKRKLQKFNQDPLHTEILSSQWPQTHHKLHTNCQEIIMLLFAFGERTIPIPRELITLISRLVIRYWHSNSFPHQPYYVV